MMENNSSRRSFQDVNKNTIDGNSVASHAIKQAQ
jgi:hypothetical protein